MAEWLPTATHNGAGQFAVFLSSAGEDVTEDTQKEVTYLRGVPVQIDSYSFGDPFSDAVAQLTFPQITPLDDMRAKGLRLIRLWSAVDIYWVPASLTQTSSRDIQVVHPQTNQKTMWLNYASKQKLWEGYIVSLDPGDDGLKVQCQGALYELDRYLAKPEYPPRPIAFDRLLKRVFDPDTRPIRTKSLDRVFPAGWSKTFPGGKATPYKPMGFKKGRNWTGFATRNTGSWDRLLTGFTQDLLSQMYTTKGCGAGIVKGNQWTIRMYEGRQPKLEIRDSNRTPDFSLWYGQPGVEARLTWDGMNVTNIIYGKGTGFDGVEWQNLDMSNDGSSTDYLPIAYHPSMYPLDEVKSRHNIPIETYVNFGNGVTLDQAMSSAEKMLIRDSQPGWTGEITIKMDPSSSLSMWKIKAGMTVLLKNYTGIDIRLHIAEVTCSPANGSVTLRVDSRYRDLLTLEELQARVRDPLTPVKMLQVNRRSITLNDMVFPWSYENGAGMMPRKAKDFFKNMPEDINFPWEEWTQHFPPSEHSEFYVKVKANNPNSKKRWTRCGVLMAQNVDIRLSQFMCVDYDGNIVRIPFHISFYQYPSIDASMMPMTDGNYSPFLPNHFQSTAPNGLPWPSGSFFPPGDAGFLTGWGWEKQKAGYSPRRSSEKNAEPTGLLVDEASWNFSANPQNFPVVAGQGDSSKVNSPKDTVYAWAMIYAEHTSPVYFIGRLFRKEPGFE